jgi:hypothetical protein
MLALQRLLRASKVRERLVWSCEARGVTPRVVVCLQRRGRPGEDQVARDRGLCSTCPRRPPAQLGKDHLALLSLRHIQSRA